MLYPTGTGATPWNPPGNLFQLNGNLELKNLIITGYYESVDTNHFNMQGALINIPSAASGINITIDSCILSNSNGNHVRTDGAPNVIKITNSTFANMGYLGRSNLGGGKALDLRNATCDSLFMVNNTFVNWQDRIIRHYPNSVGGTVGAIKYLIFDHNTLVNGMSFHGMLSLGTVGNRAIITNNLFVDAFALGNDLDTCRQNEFITSGEKDPVGNPKMNWIFTYPNTTTVWTIAKNFYVVSDSGQAFYNQYKAAGVTGEGSPLTWHLNGRLGADSSKAFTKISLTMTKVPSLMTKLMRWYRAPDGGKMSKNTPGAWTYGTPMDPFDYDRKGYAWLRDSLNCKFPTTSAAYTGATNGQPVGALTWWNMVPADVRRNSDIVPTTTLLDQNYPNPFNPATTIGFEIAKPGFVLLTVYNALGQEVAKLVQSQMAAGRYTAEFDASRLASGMYLYKLSAGGYVSVKKMLVTK
jgi:hypothetical protein